MDHTHPGICLPERLVIQGLLRTHNWVKPNPGCDTETSFMKTFLKCPTLLAEDLFLFSSGFSSPHLQAQGPVPLASFPLQCFPFRATHWCHTYPQSRGSGENNTWSVKSAAHKNSSQSVGSVIFDPMNVENEVLLGQRKGKKYLVCLETGMTARLSAVGRYLAMTTVTGTFS